MVEPDIHEAAVDRDCESIKGGWQKTHDLMQDVLTHSWILEKRLMKHSLLVGGLLGAAIGALLMRRAGWDQILVGMGVFALFTAAVFAKFIVLLVQFVLFLLSMVFPPRNWFPVASVVGALSLTVLLRNELNLVGAEFLLAFLLFYMISHVLCLVLHGLVDVSRRLWNWMNQRQDRRPG